MPIPQWWVSKAHQYAALFSPLSPQNRRSKTTLRPISEPRLHLNGKVHQVLGIRKMQQDQYCGSFWDGTRQPMIQHNSAHRCVLWRKLSILLQTLLTRPRRGREVPATVGSNAAGGTPSPEWRGHAYPGHLSRVKDGRLLKQL